MPVPESTLRDTLLESFPDAEIKLVDLAGDDDHWQGEIESKAFEGKSRIDQHRLVQDAVKGLDLHAFSFKTKGKQ